MALFRPGEIVEIRGQRFKVAATNFEGKLILHPLYHKETAVDMMTRLQSTSLEAGVIRAPVVIKSTTPTKEEAPPASEGLKPPSD